MKLLLFSFLSFFGLNGNAELLQLNADNTVVYRGEVNSSSAQSIEIQLAELDELRGSAEYPLYLVVDSPGGSIYVGEQFIQAVKTVRNLKTVSIFAASMASAIVEGLPGERLVTQNGIIMFHRAKGSFEGQFEEGEVESQLALWKNIVRGMEQRNADRMFLSLSDYKEQVRNESWIYGQDNISKKSADKIIDIVCSKDLTNSNVKVIQESLFGTAELTFSGCPLLRAPISSKRQEGE